MQKYTTNIEAKMQQLLHAGTLQIRTITHINERQQMYEAKKFDHLLGTSGFSDDLLANHFTLYQGYVSNTNKVSEILSDMARSGGAGSSEFGELKRRFGWEFNGMRLHEYYFGNMSKKAVELGGGTKFAKSLEANFGSLEDWERDFTSTGAIRGIGWVILAEDVKTGKLFNTWINEHDGGLLAGSKPLLVMDVFEHAFMIDYGLKRAEYISAFMASVDWSVVEDRYNK